jgi:ribose/xylose/arabinose/galactoside ABC-type transport system permease subunit
MSAAGALERLRDRSSGTGFVDMLFVPAVVLLLGVYLAATSDAFLTDTNLTNILLQASILAIVAFGATFVILAGELDLSVGTGAALVSVIAAQVMKDSGSIALGLLAGIGIGLLVGALNGAVVTRLEVPSFIATLGMFIIAHGVALAITDGGVVAGLPEGVGALANDKFLGLQWVIWLMFGVFAVLYFVQRQTAFGIKVFAVGGNREAARLSGIPVERIRFLVFVISGLTIGIAGLALMARVESGQPNAGGLLALESIAAIVVGGTSLLGGRGSVARTLWGVLLIAVLRNGLDLKGVDEDLKQVVIGVVFIGAASVDFFRRQLSRRKTELADIPTAREAPVT